MGQVTRISLEANPRDASVTIPVYIRLDENSIVRAGVTGELTDNFRQEILRRLIQRGLRARLQLQSLITGQYRVELDFLPNTPANFRSPMPDREIPTLPSPIDTLQRTVASPAAGRDGAYHGGHPGKAQRRPVRVMRWNAASRPLPPPLKKRRPCWLACRNPRRPWPRPWKS